MKPAPTLMPELLAPAKNCDVAIAAVNHGADAVYMAANRFGARAAAGNTMADVERAARYAHLFGAKLYLTLNTILYEHELDDARKLAKAAYNAGCDALIVQDMALLAMDIPPIALHASTQCHCASAEKVQLLADAGFARVVLARELSASQIADIRKAVPAVELEAFVHGALCVSYSGQCYLSCLLTGRSANRGECAQPCRSAYNLTDATGSVLVRNKHLLSLRDLNLSQRLPALAQSGVCSFKIEGRLKEADYVKNIVAYYRRVMDAAFADMRRPSSGSVMLNFEPNPNKTFSRGYTTYFNTGAPSAPMASIHTPKSMGEAVGRIERIERSSVTLAMPASTALHAGDGVCLFDRNNVLHGTSVIRADGNRIVLNSASGLSLGATLYRNADAAFRRLLSAESSAVRSISATITFNATPTEICIAATDEDGIAASLTLPQTGTEATNEARAQGSIAAQLGKSGGTAFRVDSVRVSCYTPLFYKAAALNEWRRALLQQLEERRRAHFDRLRHLSASHVARRLPACGHEKKLDYRANVLNSLARQFYEQQGVASIEPAFEQQLPSGNAELMRTRYCLLRELGRCKKLAPQGLREPLYLENNGRKLRLQFDCCRCEMVVLNA